MAGRLVIAWDPLDGQGIQDAAVAQTWARLSVRAVDNGRTAILTRVLDRQAKTERHEVYGTVLPLAEWIARCWHALFSARTSRPSPHAARRERLAWSKTHRWRFCSEGTAVPDLEFVRIDDDLFECRWHGSAGDESDELERILFLSDGVAPVPTDELQRTLAEFVDSVLARLDATVPGQHRAEELRKYWRVARDPSDPDFVVVRLAARLGMHWWALPEPRRKVLVELVQQELNPVTEAGLEHALEAGLDAWIGIASSLWDRCRSADSARSSWSSLRESLGAHPNAVKKTERPWVRGWATAEALRQNLGLPLDRPFDARSLAQDIGTVHVDVQDERVKSIIGWSAGRSPLVARRRPQKGYDPHFAETRDLFPLLFLGKPGEDFGCVLSDRIAGVLPVANAFATELLAPIERVRHATAGRDRVDSDDLAEIAAELDAPPLCVRHQVENHDLAEIN